MINEEKSANTDKQTLPLRFSSAETLQMEVKTRDVTVWRPPRARSFSAVRFQNVLCWQSASFQAFISFPDQALPSKDSVPELFQITSPPHLHEFTPNFLNSAVYQIGLFCLKQLHEAARPQDSGSMSQNKLKNI